MKAIDLRPTLVLLLILLMSRLYGCGGGGDKPNKSDPYGEMARGLRDKGAHKKGYGFND